MLGNKNIKIILALSIILLLSGCTVNYNLKIDDKMIYDKLETNKINSEYDTSKFTIEQQLKSVLMFSADNIDPLLEYKKEINFGDQYSGIDYTNSYLISDYKNIPFLSCFAGNNIVNSKKELYIDLYGKFGCFSHIPNAYKNNTTININIETEHMVLENNADDINGNVYTWKLKDSDDAKRVYMILDKTKKFGYKSKAPYIVLGSLVLVVILLILSLIKIRFANNKNNKI